MERRDVLCAGGAALAVGLAGCAGESKPGDESTTDETTATAEKTTTTTENPETTETDVGPAETEYDFGETHGHDHWTLTVTDFELTTTFQTNDSGTYDMPSDRKLGLATVELTNQSSEEQVWAAKPFAVIFGGDVYEEQVAFEHPGFSDNVALDDLKQVEHMRQFAPQGYPIESGLTVKLWALFVLPADAPREEMSVGFDGESSDGTTYPVRWTSN